MKRRTLFVTGAAATAGIAATVVGADLARADSTVKWTEKPFTYNIQKPYDLDVSQRYKHEGGVHTMWVYDTDKPHNPDSDTDPRTEMRWLQEYGSGQHRWGGDIYIPSGVSGPCVLQILRVRRPAGTPSTDIQLRVYNQDGGTLRRYGSGGEVVATGVYDRWVNITMTHYTGSGTIQVRENGELKLSTSDRGPAERHFKNGVYGKSGRMEARFRNLKYWTQ